MPMENNNNNNSNNSNAVGAYCYEIAKKLFPICRSITGNGFRQSLAILKEELPEINVFEVPSGTEVFDWTVPKEWNCIEAYIEDENHKRIIDFKENEVKDAIEAAGLKVVEINHQGEWVNITAQKVTK